MYKHYLIILVFFISQISQISKAQSTDLTAIFKAEKNLLEKFSLLRSDPYDIKNDSLHLEILREFSEILAFEESFFYTWPELDMIGKIQSDDKKLNIYTWNMQTTEGEHFYSGIIQQRIPQRKKKIKIVIHKLFDNSANIKSPETQYLSPDNWLGALYYSLKQFTHRRETYYALMGFDFNTRFSNKKLIDILHFEDEKVRFGSEIETESGIVKRLIFEYSSEIVMTLRYDEILKKIVFDHLSPLDPMFRGVYRFYAPDGSYDALLFEKGTFILKRDIDARNF